MNCMQVTAIAATVFARRLAHVIATRSMRECTAFAAFAKRMDSVPWFEKQT